MALCQFQIPCMSRRSLAGHGCHPLRGHPHLQVCVWVKHHQKGFCPFHLGQELVVGYTPTCCLRLFILTQLCPKNSTDKQSSGRPELLAGEIRKLELRTLRFWSALTPPDTHTVSSCDVLAHEANLRVLHCAEHPLPQIRAAAGGG